MRSNFKVFLQTFLSLMVKMFLIMGWAFLIAALLISLFPNKDLETELPIPAWVVFSFMFMAMSFGYLWVGERIKRFEHD